MTLSRPAKWAFGADGAGCALPSSTCRWSSCVINSFNASRVFSWPPQGYTTDWWHAALTNPGARSAALTSVLIARRGHALRSRAGHADRVCARALLLLRSPDGVAVDRAAAGAAGDRDGACPAHRLQAVAGNVVGVARCRSRSDGDRRTCNLLHRRGLQQRHRSSASMGTSPEEASMDLGAGLFTTFRLVTFPADPARARGRVRSWRSGCPSTRSSSRSSPHPPTSQPCRSGSSKACSDPIKGRS